MNMPLLWSAFILAILNGFFFTSGFISLICIILLILSFSDLILGGRSRSKR